MNTTIGRSSTLVPAAAQFDVWTAYDWRNGVLITELAPHDRVTVQTRNSLYEIIITVPHTAEVMVRGGAFFPEFTPARVAGSSLGGSFLKLHGVYPGFQLEIVPDGQPIVTTRIRTIVISSPQAGKVM
jgi:hypothetical protein